MALGGNGSKGAAERAARRLKIPLWLKFAAVTAVLVALLLLASAAIALWHGYTEAERSALAIQQQKAEALAGRIEDVLGNLESQLAWTAQPAWKNAGIEQQRADFARVLQQFPAVAELFHIDGKGAEQLKLSRFAPDSIASRTSYSNDPRFLETVKARTWFGPVYVRNGAQLAATVGVAHPDGGATIAELDLGFLNDLAKAAGADGAQQAFIVDSTGRLIGHPDRNPVGGDNDLSRLPQVAAALAAGGEGTTAEAVEGDGGPALAAFAREPKAGWVAIVQMPEAKALASFQTLLWQTNLLFLIGLLVAAVAGMSLARRVASPIKRLMAGAERLADGDLTQRVDVSRRDEIGMLAEKFNAMASRLQQSHKGFEARIDDRAQGLDIAQQQHALTADMLKTISRSDYRLEQVLDTLIGSAVRLTEANVGAVWLRQGDAFRLAAQLGHTKDWVDAARKEPFTAGSETHAMAAAAAYSGQVINVDDVLRDVRFAGDYGERPAYSNDERSALALPLKDNGRVEAVFALSRADPLPFSERQAALAQDFADQALIAIRHMKLLDEVATRDRAIARSSEEQAAIGDIVRAIAASPADARPILDAIARNAARLCDAPHCHIELFDGQLLHFKAGYGLPPEASRSFPVEPLPGTAAARALDTATVVEIADLQAEQETGALFVLLGSKSVVAAPLLKEGRPIGVLSVERHETGALPTRQIELLKTFAGQAAIALESGRLSEELSAGTSGLAASLEREAATETLLQTVSRIDYDLDGILTGLAARAARECAADEVQVFRLDGDVLRDASGGQAAAEGHAGLARRVIAGAAAISMPDAREDPDYIGKRAADRSMLGLPLLAKGTVVGAMTLSRSQVLPFGEEQAKLAAGLADQAALAVTGAQLPRQLAERTAERDEWRNRHAADTEAAERRRMAEVDEARRLHAAEVAETRERYETELGEARRLHEADIAEARRLHIADVTETRERYETELGESRRAHAEELTARTAERDEWQQRHAADTEAAERRRVAEIEEAIRLHAAETAEARRLHVAEVDEAHQRREAELAEAQTQHAEELAATIAAHTAKLDETIATYTAQLDETRDRHVAELAETRRLHAAELGEARRLHVEDRDTARLQRAATAEALKRLADPSAGLDPVLQAIVGSAVRACGAEAGVLFLKVGDWIKAAVTAGLPDEEHEATLSALRDRIAAEVIAQGKTVLAELPAEGTFHSALAVPLLQDGMPQGTLVLLGSETNPFDGELANLAESFADQAAIAIETERLTELAAFRADQLDEARRFREAAAGMLDLVGAVEADPQQALDAIVATAAELCQARSAELSLAENGALRPVAAAGTAAGGAPAAQLAFAEGHTVHVATEAADGGVSETGLAVPLMLGGKAAGVLTLRREKAFSDREIELTATLAAQAGIAMAKAGLAVALAESNRSLARALDERQATARMLAAIGRQRFDLGSVLAALTRSAAELSGAQMAAICLDNNGVLEAAESTGFPAGWPGDGSHRQIADLAGRAMREAAPLHSSADAGNALAVPLVGEHGPTGALIMVRPAFFGEEDVAAASMLADQAAIAIGTVRLIDEAAARTAEMHETLRQQAATAAGLKAIGRSAFDLNSVLSALTASAAALCNAGASAIHLLSDGAYHLASATGMSPEHLARERSNPSRPGRNSFVGRTALEKAVIHVPDVANDPLYPDIAKSGGAVLCVPLWRNETVVGVFMLTRPEAGPFSERQIALVESFADQAAIAAETARLANEVETRAADMAETLRQQTAVAYILRLTSRSGFDLGRVLDALTASAVTLCNASGAEIYTLADGAYRLIASSGVSQTGQDAWIGRAVLEKAVVHVPDAGLEGAAGASGAVLCVPLLRESEAGGVLALTRPEPFSERQIELVRTLADQAVIAIESTRLAEEAKASSDELAGVLQDLHALQKRVSGMEKLATVGRHAAGVAADIRSSLVSVKDFSSRSDRLVNDIRMVLEGAVLDSRVREEVEELGDTLKANLDKVVELGKRADSVVANVLQLDGNSDPHRPVDINTLVDESLGVAYSSARAERQDFDVRLEKTYDPSAGKVDLYPQDITRALLSLIANGFDATLRRRAAANGSGYEPALAVSTKTLGDAVEISIRDNGIGIPPEVQARMFDPFFTTKPAGEGAGLGLSLSRDIIVKQHSGTIEVETEPGSHTEVRIVLPRGAVLPAKYESGHQPDTSPEARPPGSIPFFGK